MKKLILNMLLLCGITVAAHAQSYDPVPMANTPATQLENNALFNNPAQNGYPNEIYRSYWIWDKASSTWVRRVELVGPVPNANKAYKANNQSNIIITPTNTYKITVATKPPEQ